MSAAADVPHLPSHHGDANLHPPPIHWSSRISHLIVGIFLFIGSEIMLFGSFFTVYFFCRVVNPDTTQWPPEGYIRPWYIALVNTCILVTSSFTVHWATQSIKRGNRTGLQCGLTLTFLLGLTFLLTQVVEYHRHVEVQVSVHPQHHLEHIFPSTCAAPRHSRPAPFRCRRQLLPDV